MVLNSQLWINSLNADGQQYQQCQQCQQCQQYQQYQQCHWYEQNEQPPLTSNKWTHKQMTKDDI